jgi:hypothetical protein
MRPDMAKVVTERPRRGHSNKSMKTSKTLSRDEIHDMGDEDADSGPGRHKASRRGQYGWDAKEFSDLLGPLRGYLKKQVGRPWNKVFSELCEHLDKRSITGQHIWDHIKYEVELNAYISDGKVFERPRFGSIRLVQGLYVHPVTGILRWAPERPRHRYRPRLDPNLKKLTDRAELRRIDGIWFYFEYVLQEHWRTETSADGTITRTRLSDELVLHKKQQLSKAQLRLHQLTNTPPDKSLSRRERQRLNSARF